MSAAYVYAIPNEERQRLRIYCYRYPGWKKALSLLTHTSRAQRLDQVRTSTGAVGKPTEQLAIKRAALSHKTRLIEDTAKETDPLMYPFLIRGVTERKMTYEKLRAAGLAVSRNTYYDRYRKFYYLLHQKDMASPFIDAFDNRDGADSPDGKGAPVRA